MALQYTCTTVMPQWLIQLYLSSFLILRQDSKFGFGGMKKGMKRNTTQSFSDVSSFNSAKHSKAPRARAGNMVRNKGMRKNIIIFKNLNWWAANLSPINTGKYW